jgi:hypothetical protein
MGGAIMHNLRHHLFLGGLIVSATVLMLALLSLTIAAPSLAQSGGTFGIVGGTANAGRTSGSGDGRFVLSGVMGQPDAALLGGGRFELAGGLEQPAACSGAPEAVTVTIGRDQAAAVLNWVDRPDNSAHSVYRDTAPFFAPSPTTQLDTVWPGKESYIDGDALGDPANNYTYIVRARCGGLWRDAGRVGGFNFRLTPGN